MDIGYARVSTTKQELGWQLAALAAEGIPAEAIHVDQKSGATTARPSRFGGAAGVAVVGGEEMFKLHRGTRGTRGMDRSWSGWLSPRAGPAPYSPASAVSGALAACSRSMARLSLPIVLLTDGQAARYRLRMPIISARVRETCWLMIGHPRYGSAAGAAMNVRAEPRAMASVDHHVCGMVICATRWAAARAPT